MKEWSNKPSALVQTSSSPVKTVSSSSLIKTSSPLVQTSGSLVKTSSSATTLTSGTSSITLSSSSLGGTGTTLTRRAAIGAAVAGPLTVGVVAGGMSMVLGYGQGRSGSGSLSRSGSRRRPRSRRDRTRAGNVGDRSASGRCRGRLCRDEDLEQHILQEQRHVEVEEVRVIDTSYLGKDERWGWIVAAELLSPWAD